MPSDAPEPPLGARDPLRVLLVVHDVRTLIRYREHLAAAGPGFRVNQVASLEKALACLREQAPDVALIDLELPEAQGRDVLHRIRIASEVAPIVVLCDAQQPSLTSEALQLGAQDCLSRDETDADLVARTIRHAIERQRLVRQLREARAREHHDATHDALTCLGNRQAFMAGLGRAVASAQRRAGQLALLYFDLDSFKAVNDGLGHEAGDLLLSEVGRRLREITRRSDLVARLGGDEFAVVLNDPEGPRAAMRAAEEFIAAISAPIRIREQECRVGASVGVAFFPQDGEDADALLRSADLAMYSAKQHPGSQVSFYEEAMDREVHERFALVADVREATRRNELFLEFQPQVDVGSGRLVGAEALLRWQHPERGRLAPAEFLAIAEDTGMIQEIGRWVLREACLAANAWGRAANAPFVAVNLSRHQLGDPLLVDEIQAALAASGLLPRRLVLEIEEPGMVDAAGRLPAVLEAVAGHGVRLAIDHFGSGAGSLRLLQWPAIRMLKIDPALLDGVGSGGRSDRILRSLLGLARELGLAAVAEGVAQPSQLAALRRLGCTRMQGYLLGPPLQGKELAALIDDERAPWRMSLGLEPRA